MTAPKHGRRQKKKTNKFPLEGSDKSFSSENELWLKYDAVQDTMSPGLRLGQFAFSGFDHAKEECGPHTYYNTTIPQYYNGYNTTVLQYYMTERRSDRCVASIYCCADMPGKNNETQNSRLAEQPRDGGRRHPSCLTHICLTPYLSHSHTHTLSLSLLSLIIPLYADGRARGKVAFIRLAYQV